MEAVRVASLLPLFRHTSITPPSLSSGLVGVRSATAAAPCPGSYASEVHSHLHPEQAFLFRDHTPLISVLRPSPESHISNKLQDLFPWLFTLIQSYFFSKGWKPGNLEWLSGLALGTVPVWTCYSALISSGVLLLSRVLFKQGAMWSCCKAMGYRLRSTSEAATCDHGAGSRSVGHSVNKAS